MLWPRSNSDHSDNYSCHHNNLAQVVIQGTVTDQSPGQTCLGIPEAGTPAISDASQEAWMEYLFEQQPQPMNATGVPVTLSVIDSNNNTRVIGQTVSDSSGLFSFQYKPDITGKYTVIASFAGSQSYFGSSGEASFAVDAAAPTAAPPTATPTSVADVYFMPAIISLVVIMIVGFALLAVLALRKRP